MKKACKCALDYEGYKRQLQIVKSSAEESEFGLASQVDLLKAWLQDLGDDCGIDTTEEISLLEGIEFSPSKVLAAIKKFKVNRKMEECAGWWRGVTLE